MALAAFALAPAHLLAEWRCDCTTVTDACAASVSAEPGWVTVRSNTESCSRVDYYIDGQPLVSTVVGGERREPWVSQSGEPEVLVSSCQVCADRGDSPPAADAAAAAGAEAAPAALQAQVAVEPDYPSAGRGRSGEVRVRVQVAPDGTVSGARVIGATPRGVFDAASVSAIRRWRYPAVSLDSEPRTTVETLRFRPPAAVAASAPAREAVSDGRINARNGCIKAGQTHDLVDMLQVELVNACAEPVMVYACAEGLGRDSGKWVCDSNQRRRSALARPGDPRTGRKGSLSTDVNYLRYSFTSNQYVVHPPGSRYVWVGCSLDDLDCHDAALAWQSLLSARPSSVDPRRSGDIAIAASGG